jgi:hypothetical protein
VKCLKGYKTIDKMRLLFIILSVIISFLMATQSGKAQTEQQRYTLVQKFPGFEVRYYPEAVMARVSTDARSYREMSSPSFRALAGYIFGGNTEGRKIAMTAPVYIDLHEDGSQMSFVMPSEYDLAELPQPNNPDVQIERTRPIYAAALTFGGYASDQVIREESEKLRKMLLNNQIEFTGNFRFLGYNSPYKFWDRRNEILVQIIWE